MQNKYFKFLIIILAVVIVVPQVALASWWNPMSWGWINSIFHFQKTQQQVQKVDTKDWKTYTNNDQGFQVKYPSEFVFDENNNYPASGDVIVTFRRPSYGDWSLSIGGPVYNSLGKEETLQEAVNNYKIEYNSQQVPITVAGKKSQEFIYIDKDNNNIEEVTIYVPRDNGKFFSINWKSSEDISKDKKVQNSKSQFYQILSTFKFINSTDLSIKFSGTESDFEVKAPIQENYFDLVGKAFYKKNLSVDKTESIKFITTDKTEYVWTCRGVVKNFQDFYNLNKAWDGPMWNYKIKGMLSTDGYEVLVTQIKCLGQ